MIIGICALCLESRALLESHFLPAALYKNLMDPDGIIKNMIVSNQKTASEESKQMKRDLLCQGCEIRFQQGGENWVLGKRLMPNDSFPLREILLKHPADETRNGGSFYKTDGLPEIKPVQLLYFAASIFWRASACDWDTPLGLYQQLVLPSDTKESLRRFLLGEEQFPQGVGILLILSASARPLDLMTLPALNTGETQWKQFEFYVPGMKFVMIVGSSNGLNLSLSRSPHAVAIDPKLVPGRRK